MEKLNSNLDDSYLECRTTSGEQTNGTRVRYRILADEARSSLHAKARLRNLKKAQAARWAHKVKCAPKVFTKMRPDAKYVSARGQEYTIEPTGTFWKVVPYKGGQLPKSLKQVFTSYNLCEQELITFLRSKDKWGKARYPGNDAGSNQQTI